MQENGSVFDPPRKTSFGHLDISQSSQVRNPIIGGFWLEIQAVGSLNASQSTA